MSAVYPVVVRNIEHICLYKGKQAVFVSEVGRFWVFVVASVTIQTIFSGIT
jgi:hypothetical protein